MSFLCECCFYLARDDVGAWNACIIWPDNECRKECPYFEEV